MVGVDGYVRIAQEYRQFGNTVQGILQGLVRRVNGNQVHSVAPGIAPSPELVNDRPGVL